MKTRKIIYVLIAVILLTNGCSMLFDDPISRRDEFSGGYEVVKYTSDGEALLSISDLFSGGEEYLYKKARWGEEVRVGPTQYGMCGFVKYSEDEFAKFLLYDDYFAETPIFPEGISEKDISDDELNWHHSARLDEAMYYTYIGSTYVDFSNYIIYFSVSR